MKIIVDAEGRRVELDDGVTFAVTMAAAPSTASGNVTTGPTVEYLEAHQRIALAMWRETAPSHRQPAGFSAPVNGGQSVMLGDSGPERVRGDTRAWPERPCGICGRPERQCMIGDPECRPAPAVERHGFVGAGTYCAAWLDAGRLVDPLSGATIVGASQCGYPRSEHPQ